MIDRSFIGKNLDPYSVEVEKGQLRFFAKATGQKDPVYLDEKAAKKAGYPALPAPPTFFFTLEQGHPEPYRLIDMMGVDIGRILHGEQKFDYFKPICAGDTITFREKIVDIYDKKDGAMEFIVTATEGVNQKGETVGTTTKTVIVRN